MKTFGSCFLTTNVFVFLMLVVSIVWSCFFNFEIYGCSEGLIYRNGLFGSDTYFSSEKHSIPDLYFEKLDNNHLDDVFFDAPLLDRLLWMEVLFVSLPFIIYSIPLCFVKNRKTKLCIGFILVAVIACFQSLYGYMWYRLWNDFPDVCGSINLTRCILLYGGGGILLSATYGVTFGLTYKKIIIDQLNYSRFKVILLSHLSAIVAFFVLYLTIGFGYMGVIVFLAYIFVVDLLLCLVYFVLKILNVKI